MIHAFPQAMLSSQRLLDDYLEAAGEPPTSVGARYQRLWQLLFVETRAAHGTQLPDHAYRNMQARLQVAAPDLASLLLSSLEGLAADLLMLHRQRVHAIPDAFERWQCVITRVTPVPLIAYRLAMAEHAPAALWAAIQDNLAKSTLPCLDAPFVDAVMADAATSELHVHLNGTTEADLVWQDAIERPGQFHRLIMKAAGQAEVREHYLQIGARFDEFRLYNLLYLAQHLRVLIVDEVFNGRSVSLADVRGLDRRAATALSSLARTASSGGHPAMRHVPRTAQVPGRVEVEAYMLARAFEHLGSHPHEGLATALHQYLLILNSLNRLLVHQLHQKGFDQFQRLTINEAREQAESDYLARFRQLEGMHGERLAYVEGRFAPKSTAKASLRLTKRIIRDYERYRGIGAPNLFRPIQGPLRPARLELGLVAHFIKKRPKAQDGHLFQDLRRDLRAQARGLVFLADRIQKIGERLRGFDAAANELHAPPEVFAPTFRYLRRQGFPDFTFHVGEDFVHLLSGLRAVHEAVVFLDLGPGCRIGHGTAVGVRPDVWMAACASPICISRGAWLDDLVFAYDRLSATGQAPEELHRLQAAIAANYYAIHGDRRAFDLQQLQVAWRLRRHDPDVVLGIVEAGDILDVEQRREFGDWAAEEQANPTACELHRAYLRDPLVKAKREAWIDVEPGYLGPAVVTCLQATIIEDLNRRQVAIESMPTSNVRIGVYEKYRDHHLFRWLGIEQADPLPRPIVLIASDNPGVFATSVHHELAHVYNTLVRDFGLSHQEAFEQVQALNRTGGMYRFKGRA